MKREPKLNFNKMSSILLVSLISTTLSFSPFQPIIEQEQPAITFECTAEAYLDDGGVYTCPNTGTKLDYSATGRCTATGINCAQASANAFVCAQSKLNDRLAEKIRISAGQCEAISWLD